MSRTNAALFHLTNSNGQRIRLSTGSAAITLNNSRDEAQVSNGAFIADEPLAVLEHALQHAPDAEDLLLVPLTRARGGLGVEQQEPPRLPEVRSDVEVMSALQKS